MNACDLLHDARTSGLGKWVEWSRKNRFTLTMSVSFWTFFLQNVSQMLDRYAMTKCIRTMFSGLNRVRIAKYSTPVSLTFTCKFEPLDRLFGYFGLQSQLKYWVSFCYGNPGVGGNMVLDCLSFTQHFTNGFKITHLRAPMKQGQPCIPESFIVIIIEKLVQGVLPATVRACDGTSCQGDPWRCHTKLSGVWIVNVWGWVPFTSCLWKKKPVESYFSWEITQFWPRIRHSVGDSLGLAFATASRVLEWCILHILSICLRINSCNS